MTTVYERFAKFSGAKISRKTEAEPTLAVELPDVIEDDNTEPAGEEEANYVQEKFKKNTAPWKNPKITLGVVSVISLSAALTGAAIFNGQFQLPDFSKASATKPTDDDIAPQPPGDGKWQSAAIGMGLGQGFQKEGERKNPYLQNSPPNANAKNKTDKGKPKGIAGTGVTPTYRTMAVRPAQVPPAYVSPAPTRYASYTPATYSSRPSYPRYSVSAPSPSARPQTPPQQTPERQLSPQERIAAMLAATSTGTNGTPSGGAVASAPTDYIPTSSQKSQYPLAEFVAQSRQTQPVAQQMAYLPSEAAVIDGQSQTLINRSASAKATLLNGIGFSANDYASLEGQPVEIELAQPLGDIPAGAQIVTVVDAGNQRGFGGSASKAVVRLKATAIALGDTEIPLPDNALLISGSDGSPLIASRGGSGFLRTVGGIIGTLAGGAGQSNYGASQNARFGDSSYLTSVGTNIATGLVGNAARGLQQSGNSDVLVLKAGKSIKVSVLKPFALPQLSQLSQPIELSPLSQQPGNEQPIAQVSVEPTDAQLMAIKQEVGNADPN
jgi:hypothetical protein